MYVDLGFTFGRLGRRLGLLNGRRFDRLGRRCLLETKLSSDLAQTALGLNVE